MTPGADEDMIQELQENIKQLEEVIDNLHTLVPIWLGSKAEEKTHHAYNNEEEFKPTHPKDITRPPDCSGQKKEFTFGTKALFL